MQFTLMLENIRKVNSGIADDVAWIDAELGKVTTVQQVRWKHGGQEVGEQVPRPVRRFESMLEVGVMMVMMIVTVLVPRMNGSLVIAVVGC